jgi:hypothetical protein
MLIVWLLYLERAVPWRSGDNSCSLLPSLHLNKGLEGLKKFQPIFCNSSVKVSDLDLESQSIELSMQCPEALTSYIDEI